MIELAVVILILGIFVSPLYVSAGCLGLYTTWLLFRSYESFKNQPLEGRRVLFLTRIFLFINFIASTILAALLALLVYILIFDYFYLALFNFIFSFLISIRWFDFSYRFFRHWIIGQSEEVDENYFVLCKGFKEIGRAPAFTDAGLLNLETGHAVFKGTFFNTTFNSKNIQQAEKISSEKIKIYTHPSSTRGPNIFLFILKDHFYPFRSRDKRDIIFNSLSNVSSLARQSI
ncbi:MAG: hypothetical protein H8E32_11665 [Nitrospinae bacterium]|nr:hypothetical protein [Nitrospinota bacterium]